MNAWKVVAGALAAAAAVALLLGWESRYLLVRPGMTTKEVEAILGKHDFVDVLSDVPPGQGHGTFYYESLLRPYLTVEWGPDRKVRNVSRYREGRRVTLY